MGTNAGLFNVTQKEDIPPRREATRRVAEYIRDVFYVTKFAELSNMCISITMRRIITIIFKRRRWRRRRRRRGRIDGATIATTAHDITPGFISEPPRSPCDVIVRRARVYFGGTSLLRKVKAFCRVVNCAPSVKAEFSRVSIPEHPCIRVRDLRERLHLHLKDRGFSKERCSSQLQSLSFFLS